MTEAEEGRVRIASRLAREPLVHFVLLGAALFGVHAAVVDREATVDDSVIEVSEGRVFSMIETFTRQWSRAPSPDELDGLIADFVREEALAREAVALGLDRDDTIIRRRLAQKLGFVVGDLETIPPPTDDVLRKWYDEHPERYRIGDRVSFEQVAFDPQRHGDRFPAVIRDSLARLNADGAGVAGDLRLYEPRYDALARADVVALFGDDFERELAAVPTGAWVGPISSGVGEHVVRVLERTPGVLSSFAEVRERVVADYQAESTRRRADERVAAILAKYQVRYAPVLARESGSVRATRVRDP